MHSVKNSLFFWGTPCFYVFIRNAMLHQSEIPPYQVCVPKLLYRILYKTMILQHTCLRLHNFELHYG